VNAELKTKLQEFERDHNCRVVYVTKYGSKLYGTDNENSDTDYKGVFVPAMDDVLLKKDLEHWTSNSNNTNKKNGADDVDLQLFSVHKFFELLRKGETGAIDLLFSMWSPAVEYADPVFDDHIKMYHTKFLNKKLHSFTGYAVGQAKKYGVKGTRYKELTQFLSANDHYIEQVGEGDWFMNNDYDDMKLEKLFPEFKGQMMAMGLKYISFVDAPGPKTGKGENVITYIEVLGKKFSGDVTVGYFFGNIANMLDQFGNRTRSSAEGVDWKALSHSVRVLLEVEELLDTSFVEFPLREADFVKQVKEGKMPVDVVMMFVNSKLDQVKAKLDTNERLREESDREEMDDLELFFLNLYGSKND